jgi:predicted Zn-dependent protease
VGDVREPAAMPDAGENENQAYNNGFVRGRSFFHPKLGFTFTAPEGFVLEDRTDAILGENNAGDKALRFSAVTVPTQQTFAEYLNSGFIKNVDPKSIRYLEINGLPAATATATSDTWAFYLYVIRLRSRVYQFIFTSKDMASAPDLVFFDAVNTFRPLELAEVECPKGRTFTWRITEIEAGATDPAEAHTWHRTETIRNIFSPAGSG